MLQTGTGDNGGLGGHRACLRGTGPEEGPHGTATDT
ncbi:rCG40858 [Rattus norvegicus]|uniref:RCG40858 n=1 Tax=Rattus norvegicus TaxID=10116 RepID=A6KKZ1_RAT|nr:rCG40858 [Rattus norvegicus]